MDLYTTLLVLAVVLGFGTGYAWYQFYRVAIGDCDTCAVGLQKSPLRSKCFIGALFFSGALILAIYALFLV